MYETSKIFIFHMFKSSHNSAVEYLYFIILFYLLIK